MQEAFRCHHVLHAKMEYCFVRQLAQSDEPFQNLGCRAKWTGREQCRVYAWTNCYQNSSLVWCASIWYEACKMRTLDNFWLIESQRGRLDTLFTAAKQIRTNGIGSQLTCCNVGLLDRAMYGKWTRSIITLSGTFHITNPKHSRANSKRQHSRACAGFCMCA